MPKASSRHFKERITGLVLAGGASQRLQGHPQGKGLLPLQGKPLVAHVVRRLKPQVGQLAINANHYLDQYQALGFPVWSDIKEDDWEDFPGPLAGILTGLHHLQTEWLITVPCDSPLLPDDLVEKLYQKSNDTGAKIVIASTHHEGSMKDHPVFALIHTSLKNSLHNYLTGGDRKIMLWMKQHAFERVIFDDQQAFMANINTLEDFNKLNELLNK
ncbi:MAG: molybdenum cofactor guanylyltransferase MobA [Saezia sp.]